MFYEKQADQVRPADAAPLSSETNRETETQTDTPSPADSRSFYLFVTDGDLSDKKQYTRVTGKLIKHSPRVAIYLDEQQQPTELAAGLIDEVINLLEERVLDHLAQHCGSLTDVDDNGRFTVLLSPWLGKLQGGKTSINGFVRPSDFREKVAAPFSNHCDMLYLNSALKPGQELFDLLSHEVTHAVVSSIRIRQEQYLGHMLLDEEDWLNEGIAHIMEPGFTNRDYRISEFYRQPEAYPLIVPDYYRARLWRNHGCRGAVNLFLNWCNDLDPRQRFTWEFTHHPLTGVDKMEDLTEVPFAELFRQWSLSLASQALQGRFAYAGDEQFTLKISSTASAFIHLRADQKQDVPTTIRVRGFPGMQLTLVRIPRSLPQASLSAELVTTSDSEQNATNSVEIRLRCHHPTQSEVALIGAEYVGPGLSRSDRRPRHFKTEDLPETLPSTTASQIQISRQETISTESEDVSEFRLRVPLATLKRDNPSQSLLIKAVVRTQAFTPPQEVANALRPLVAVRMKFSCSNADCVSNYDARHLLLDRSDQILELAEQTPAGLPERLLTEWQSICAEVKSVQPEYKSHHKTSILFDRQGMGQPGVQKAKTLITRIVALTRSVERLESCLLQFRCNAGQFIESVTGSRTFQLMRQDLDLLALIGNAGLIENLLFLSDAINKHLDQFLEILIVTKRGANRGIF
ncbi:unnamed protein product [Symbiodinium microadriaticum]|nr:unnamed protein product [Symbiodinium microadriaticum]